MKNKPEIFLVVPTPILPEPKADPTAKKDSLAQLTDLPIIAEYMNDNIVPYVRNEAGPSLNIDKHHILDANAFILKENPSIYPKLCDGIHLQSHTEGNAHYNTNKELAHYFDKKMDLAH